MCVCHISNLIGHCYSSYHFSVSVGAIKKEKAHSNLNRECLRNNE